MELSYGEYRLLVEQAPMMIWRSDASKKCDYFNEVWLAFTGRALEQELGDGWAQGVHPEDFDACLRRYLEAFDRREPFEMEYRLRRRDGVYRWIFDRGSPFHSESGAFIGYIGSCVDVTERVEAQQAESRAQQAEVELLRGILPICAHCKRIRNEEGGWEAVEVYVRERSAAEFSHSICPTCMERYYADPM